MSVNFLIITIICFILSLVLGLVFAMSFKKINASFSKIGSILHFTFLIIAISTYFKLSNELIHHYSTLFTFCSGLILAGFIIRKEQIKKILKYYFSAYLLLIILFLYSPSLLFYLIGGNISNYQSAQEVRLKENYYLVEQQSMLQIVSKDYKYKVIQKFAIYNKTIARDIYFTDKITNATLLQFNKDTIVIEGRIKGDSIITVGLKPGMKSNTIEQKRQ